MSETKRCPHCKRLLPVEAFHQNRTRRDGRDSWCAACKSVAEAQRRRAGRSAAPKPATSRPKRAPRQPIREKIVPVPKYPELRDEAWLRTQIEREFFSAEQVAENLGCNPHTVYVAMRRYGIRTVPKGVRWALRARLVQQRSEGSV